MSSEEAGLGMSSGRFVLLGTDLVSDAEAMTDVRSQGLNWGISVFDSARAYWNPAHGQLYLIRLEDHLRRLSATSALLAIALPAPPSVMCECVIELLSANSYKEDVYVRFLTWKDAPERFGMTLTSANDKFAAYTFPIRAYRPVTRELVVRTASQHSLHASQSAGLKIGGLYVGAALAKTEASEQGFDDSVLLTSEGGVIGSTSANICFASGDRLVVPNEGVPGITRSSLLELARSDLGIEIEERRASYTELLDADEAFLCGTGAEVVTIGSIDGIAIGRAGERPLVEQLRRLYAAATHGESPQRRVWCTPVYGTVGGS